MKKLQVSNFLLALAFYNAIHASEEKMFGSMFPLIKVIHEKSMEQLQSKEAKLDKDLKAIMGTTPIFCEESESSDAQAKLNKMTTISDLSMPNLQKVLSTTSATKRVLEGMLVASAPLLGIPQAALEQARFDRSQSVKVGTGYLPQELMDRIKGSGPHDSGDKALLLLAINRNKIILGKYIEIMEEQGAVSKRIEAKNKLLGKLLGKLPGIS